METADPDSAADEDLDGSGSNSRPQQSRSVCSAAANVVPDPKNGSYTNSPRWVSDGIALANLCQAYSTLIKAQLQLTTNGILYKTKSGYIQQSPLLAIVNGQVRNHQPPVPRIRFDTFLQNPARGRSR
jgi:hypothetical protein